MSIRSAKAGDAAQIAAIYNHYILNSHSTFELEEISAGEMERRIGEIAAEYPFFVFEEEGAILGYAYAAKYKSRAAYRSSAEISVYIKDGGQGKGIGAKLYERLFDELGKMDIHAIIAGISLPNEASIRLHEKFGMEKVAHFKEVGFKLGRWIDVGYWELINDKGRNENA